MARKNIKHLGIYHATIMQVAWLGRACEPARLSHGQGKAVFVFRVERIRPGNFPLGNRTRTVCIAKRILFINKCLVRASENRHLVILGLPVPSAHPCHSSSLPLLPPSAIIPSVYLYLSRGGWPIRSAHLGRCSCVSKVSKGRAKVWTLVHHGTPTWSQHI